MSKFDVDSLSQEEIQKLSDLLGTKIKDNIDRAAAQSNKILNKYGMECKISFVIAELGSFEDKSKEPSNLIKE